VPGRDRLEKLLIDYASASRLPLLGICRGLQMLVTHYGGRLSRLEGHVATRHNVKVISEGDAIWPDTFEVNSFHQWGIASEEVKAPLKIWAKDSHGFVEAVKHESLSHYGIMWHPEREQPFHLLDISLLRWIFDL
jgi:putative glutamine amidotransferase